MKFQHVLAGFALAVLAMSGPLALHAQQVPDLAKDEAEIRAGVERYVAAFNQHDAKAVAANWLPEAVYVNKATGEQVVGQAAIEAQFKATFEKYPQLKLAVDVEAVSFISPNVAVEPGVAKFLTPAGEPELVNYRAVYVRRDGKWLLDRVTDEADEADDQPEPPPSHYEQLKELEWLVGRWVDGDDNVEIVTECRWARNRNFLVRSFAVTTGEQIEMSGMQIIGWDPSTSQIRSWTFDSDGGFAQGQWKRNENRWTIQRVGVLPDGRKSSVVNIVKRLDDDSFTFQSVSRTVGDEILPNIDEVVIKRQSE